MSPPSPPLAGSGSEGGPGLLEVEGETARVTFRRLLRHPIETVWAAITEPKQLEEWYMTKVRREDAVGGAIEMDHPGGVHATGRVIEWSPPRAYEYEWNLPPGPDQPQGEASVVRWELSPRAGGTLLVMTHRRLTRPTAGTFVRGAGELLDRLAAHLDGLPMPVPRWVRALRRRGTSEDSHPG